jgi:hypothetical protein
VANFSIDYFLGIFGTGLIFVESLVEVIPLGKGPEGSIILIVLNEVSNVVGNTFLDSFTASRGYKNQNHFEGAVCINYSFAGIRIGEQICRHSVAVERINTFILKSTYTNTHGSGFT